MNGNARRCSGKFAERFRALLPGADREELCGKLRLTGETAFRQWSNGHTMPTADKLAVIAEHFGVSCDYLLGLSDVRSPDIGTRAASERWGLSEGALQSLELTAATDYLSRRAIDALLGSGAFHEALKPFATQLVAELNDEDPETRQHNLLAALVRGELTMDEARDFRLRKASDIIRGALHAAIGALKGDGDVRTFVMGLPMIFREEGGGGLAGLDELAGREPSVRATVEMARAERRRLGRMSAGEDAGTAAEDEKHAAGKKFIAASEARKPGGPGSFVPPGGVP